MEQQTPRGPSWVPLWAPYVWRGHGGTVRFLFGYFSTPDYFKEYRHGWLGNNILSLPGYWPIPIDRAVI